MNKLCDTQNGKRHCSAYSVHFIYVIIFVAYTECRKCQSRNHNTFIYNSASHASGKKALVRCNRLFRHNVLLRNIKSQCNGRKRIGYKINPQQMYRQ